MTEVELKFLLDERAETALRASPALKRLGKGRQSRKKLLSIYFDTGGEDLRKAGIALRLRKVGQAWVQTVKRGGGQGGSGLFSLQEEEAKAPAGRLDLDLVRDEALRAAVEEARGGADLLPVFETRIDRTTRILKTELGEAELALDVGVVAAGDAEVAFREAELELKSGAPAVLYDIARELFSDIPVRFSERSKAARGYAAAAGAPALPPEGPVKAGEVALDGGQTAEAAAVAVMRACLSQIDANVAASLAADDPEGPHQLRTGLRRLRTAFGAFRRPLEGEALAGLKAGARRMGREAGVVRDLDVLLDGILRPAAEAGGPDADGLRALIAEVEVRREIARAGFRAWLRSPEARRFLLDLSAFVELRGWLRPADHAQTRLLSRPLEKTAAKALKTRRRKAREAAEGLEALTPEERHALRKELKKLRYTVDYFGGLWKESEAQAYLKALKRLQKVFGAMNDAKMAEGLLTGEDAPCAQDPVAQRAAGRLLGRMAAEGEADWARAQAQWDAFEDARPFWK